MTVYVSLVPSPCPMILFHSLPRRRHGAEAWTQCKEGRLEEGRL
jgi:hypothetical protein